MKKGKKRIFLIVIFWVGTFLFLLPFMICTTYTTPRSDDFHPSLFTNPLIDAAKETWETYMTWGGNLSQFFFQKLLNPQRWTMDYLDILGMEMLFFFVIYILAFIYAVGKAIRYLFDIHSKMTSWMLACLPLVGLLSAQIFADPFYWYVGAEYSWQNVWCMIAIAGWCDYFWSEKQSKLERCMMYVFGSMACYNFSYLLPGIVIYLMFIFLERKGKGTFNKKRIMPIIVYGINCLIFVIAPGNYARQDAVGKAPSIIKAVVYDCFHVSKVIAGLIIDPMTIIYLLGMILLGVILYQKGKKIVYKPIAALLFGAVALFACDFGESYAYQSFLSSNRTNFVITFWLIMWVSVLCIYVGWFIANRYNITGKNILTMAGALIVLSYTFLFPCGEVKELVVYKTLFDLNNAAANKEKFRMMLDDIRFSDEEEVVIYAKDYRVDTIKYPLLNSFLAFEEYIVNDTFPLIDVFREKYSSINNEDPITTGLMYTITEDKEYYVNVNVAEYYGKKSVVLIW